MQIRFSIANVLWFVLTLAVILGWYVDRTNLRKDYENRIAKTEASIHVHNEDRLTTFRMNPHDEEETLYGIVDQRDAKARTLMNLLSVYDVRNEVDDDMLVTVFAHHAMERLGCDSPRELRAFVREFGFDLGLILDTEHPEHADFEQFITQAMFPP